MKTIFSLVLVVLSLAIGTACGTASQAQDNNGNIENAISSKNYTFTAQSVTPLGGRYRQLTSEYDMRVLGDSVIAYLPYFGRAYSAPIDPSKGGIDFTSTNFDYTQTARKKGGWIITIKPNDVQDVRELTLTVTGNGNATLQVISNNRQSISFNGYVQPGK
jgi:hypothetical protein